MVTLSCIRNCSRLDAIRVFYIYWRSALHTMPLSLELLQCVLAKPSMLSRHAINLRSNHRSNPHSARNVHTSTHLDVTIALIESLSVRVAPKRAIDRPSVALARTANPLLQWITNWKVQMVGVEGRGRRLTVWWDFPWWCLCTPCQWGNCSPACFG